MESVKFSSQKKQLETSQKPVILVFVRHYLPGHLGGGPIQTIANMVERLSNDYQFLIVTTDRDIGSQVAYRGVKLDDWNSVGNAQVFYATKKSVSIRVIARLIRQTHHKVLYLNSFFDPVFSQKVLLAKLLRLLPHCPVVLAPRGEFSQGALKLKRWKKLTYLNVGKILRLFDDVVWHASTSREASDIARALNNKSSEIRIAENISIVPKFDSALAPVSNSHITCSNAESIRVCFLSRISRMKNLDFALRVLNLVKVPIQFSIYGPQEDKRYWDECQELMNRLPSNISTNYYGSVNHESVRSVISQHDVFFLPTRGENFGHVILEAWSSGTPVLISDQTPWHLLKEKGLGWDFPLDKPHEFAEALTEYASETNAERLATRTRCLDFAQKLSEDPAVAERNLALFRSFERDI